MRSKIELFERLYAECLNYTTDRKLSRNIEQAIKTAPMHDHICTGIIFMHEYLRYLKDEI